MPSALRIAVAEDDPLLLEQTCNSLLRFGHEVVASVGTGAELITACQIAQPSLLISDIVLPDMSGIEAIKRVQQQRSTPAIVTSAYDDPEFIRDAKHTAVMCYLVKPVSEGNLKTNIEIALKRFADLSALREETVSLQERLMARKVIERAKGILMLRAGLSEPDAHRRLQEIASTKHRRLADIASAIVDAEDALGPGA